MQSVGDPGPTRDAEPARAPDSDRRSGEPIRVVLVTGTTPAGRALRSVLSREAGLEVVKQLRSLRSAGDAAADARTDVIVVAADPTLGGTVEAVRRLKQRVPAAEIVIVSPVANDDALIGAIEAGATALVEERDVDPALAGSVLAAAAGEDPLAEEVALSPLVVHRVVSAYRELAVHVTGRGVRVAPLSPRQLEILALVARRMSNDDVARELGISLQTVKNQLTAVLRATGTRGRDQAVAAAVKAGWLRLDE